MPDELRIIPGGIAVDDRGALRFCNDFDMRDIRRFYVVTNHEPRFIRAWHGHDLENKFVYVASGAAMVAAVEVDDWSSPDPNAEIKRFVLSEDKPAIVHIPGGYANGTMTLAPDTRIFFFSSAGLGESLDDDYRFAYDFWNAWDIVPR